MSPGSRRDRRSGGAVAVGVREHDARDQWGDARGHAANEFGTGSAEVHAWTMD